MNDVLPDAPAWPQVRDNPFFDGNLAPIADEVAFEALEVVGEIPRCLRGVFLRNGPNAQFEPPGQYHVFDGDGMLHGLWLDDGKARYRNRWIESRGLAYERKQGRACYYGAASMKFPEPEVMLRAGAVKNLANTNIVHHAGHYWALYETGRPTAVGDDLATLGGVSLEGVAGPFTAHPKIDPETGEMFAFGYAAMPPFITYYAIDPDGRVYAKQHVTHDFPVMLHDFAVTHASAVFIIGPARMDLAAALTGGDVIQWRPELGTRIVVLPRDGGKERVFSIPNCYVFHFLNAWQEGARIEVDAVRVSHIAGNQGAGDGGDDAVPKGYLTRFTIDLQSGEVRERRWTNTPTEFPRIDDRRMGRKHRYGYGVHYTMRNFPGFYDMAHRIDLETGEEQLYRFGPGRDTGELAYAPHPHSAREEDGFLMSFVYDRTRNASELAIFAASDITKGPIARVLLPRRVPAGFHGSWFPA